MKKSNQQFNILQFCRHVSMACMLLLIYSCASGQVVSRKNKRGVFPKVKIPRTESFTYHSTNVDDDFVISVSYPEGYNAYSNKTLTYDVIYGTDANGNFALLNAMTYVMQLGAELPNVIIVGIGYKTDSIWLINRNRDLIPVIEPSLETQGYKTGGGGKFLKFIKEELKPYITQNYRVSENDTYVGFSYGGLFGLFSLFTEPDLFDNYLIGSPSIWIGDGVAFTYLDQFKAGRKDYKGRIFMSEGAYEQDSFWMQTNHMIDNWEIMRRKILDLRYVHMNLGSALFPNETHLSGSSVAFNTGMRFIYKFFVEDAEIKKALEKQGK